MGDDAMIIEGVESPQARLSLYSTVHGAGRLFAQCVIPRVGYTPKPSPPQFGHAGPRT
jgi:hypothetical protein